MRQCGKWKTPVRKFRQLNGPLLPRSFVPSFSIRYWIVMQDRTAREAGAAGGRYFQPAPPQHSIRRPRVTALAIPSYNQQ
jgi:hypothetical protein